MLYTTIPRGILHVMKRQVAPLCICKVLTFIHFTHGFRSLHGSELTHFGNYVKQDGKNSHLSVRREKLACRREKLACRRETHA